MSSLSDFSWAGFALAALAGVVMIAAGVDPILVGVVVLVWVGSLMLAASRPPQVEANSASSSINAKAMREMLDLSGSPLMMTNRGKIEIANAEARRLLGEHIVGQDVRVAFRNPEAIELLTSDKGGSTIVQGLVRRRDIWRIGQQVISDRHAVIELLDQSSESDVSRAHSDFVANASHELRTPLASIIGYVETLVEDGEEVSPANRIRFHETILREANRMLALVNDLMSLSRIEAEKHDPPAQPLVLNELVEQAAKDGAGPDREARLRFDMQQNFTIRGDEQQIEQLVRNLVDNALKYGSQTESVTVALETARNDQVRMVVSDRGTGIEAEHLPHLTRRFYRTDPGRSRASGGTGLGLAIVKHIVERHRGRMTIESKIGEGTRVAIRFPLYDNGVGKVSENPEK
ncbi:two-component sensor histidine kinase [Altererythrobacter aurantiacus]|uniref:histidine kinase n=2 Tax=Parapontixanthobacter aurantiacus TaxID=1463599 RepID=A0A844ZDT2_9SPHN|nr:two-component sensor histidine kinase [Parapontixanthobacter aurantiacus]